MYSYPVQLSLIYRLSSVGKEFPVTHPTTTEHLVPIPRIGIRGRLGTLRCLLLILSIAIPPLGLSAYLLGPVALSANAVEGVAIAGLILVALYLLRTSGSAGGLMPLLVFATLFTCFSLGSAIPAAIIICLLFSVSEGALLVSTADRRGAVLLPLILLAGAALSVLLCGHWQGGILSLCPLPVAVALGLCTRSSAGRKNGLTRVGVVCATTLVAGLTLAATIAYFLYRRFGAPDTTTLLSWPDILREAAVSRLSALVSEAGDTVAGWLSPDDVTDLVNSVFNLLPGYLVAALLIFVAVAQMLLIASLHAVGLTDCLTERVRMYRISRVTDLVFLVAYVTSVVSLLGGGSLAGTVAENLVIILQPGLALGGLLHIAAQLTSRGPRRGCAPLLLLLLPVLFFVAPSALAIYEAVICLLDSIRTRFGEPPSAEADPTDSDRGSL